MRPLTRAARVAALVGYFGLFSLLMAQLTWLAPPTPIPVSIALLLLVGPLLFPLRGILQGRTYTHTWASYMALFYFAAGVFNLAGDTIPDVLAWFEIAFSLLFFVAAITFVRLRASELKVREP